MVFYKEEFRECNLVIFCVNFIGYFIYCVNSNELWKDYLCMYFKNIYILDFGVLIGRIELFYVFKFLMKILC